MEKLACTKPAAAHLLLPHPGSRVGQLCSRAATPAQDGRLSRPVSRPAGCRRRGLVFLQGEGAAALIQRAAFGGRVPPCLAHCLRRMHAVAVCCLPGKLVCWWQAKQSHACRSRLVWKQDMHGGAAHGCLQPARGAPVVYTCCWSSTSMHPLLCCSWHRLLGLRVSLLHTSENDSLQAHVRQSNPGNDKHGRSTQSAVCGPLLTHSGCLSQSTAAIKHAAGSATHLDGRRQLLLGSLIRERALRHERVPLLVLVGTCAKLAVTARPLLRSCSEECIRSRRRCQGGLPV